MSAGFQLALAFAIMAAMSNMKDLKDRVVFLTGASRGIGLAVAFRLAREQVRLAICGRDGKALAAVAREAESRGATKVFSKTFDLAQEAAILEFLREAQESLGVPDILINNAGFNERKARLAESTTAEFDSSMAVNLRAPFVFIREVLRTMIPREQGHIVNILSTTCHASNENLGVYTAAKSGLAALTGVLRKEVRPQGIRVSALYPGGTHTTFRPNDRPDYMKPESVAEAVYATLAMPDDLVVHDVTFRPMVETNF